MFKIRMHNMYSMHGDENLELGKRTHNLKDLRQWFNGDIEWLK